MRRAQRIDPQCHEWLPAAELSRIPDLLDCPPGALGLPGDWQALAKPGLGGRQRWRWRLADCAGNPVTVFVKRYERSTLKAQCDRIFRQSARHSRGWWEFRQCQRLSDAHIPAPRVIGVAEAMRGTLEHRSVVLLQAVAGEAFDRAWTQACRDDAPITRGLARCDVAARLGRFVSAFHQTGSCHRDLYFCHVFVDLDPQGRRPPAFTLIDLARSLQPRWRRMRWIIKDLAQLDSSARQIGASRADRLRFLRAYLGLQAGSPRIRWYARRIVRKSNWIVRRLARKSRRR